MILRNYYWYWTEEIKPEACKVILRRGLMLKAEEKIGAIESLEEKISLDEQGVNDPEKVRNSKVVFLNDQWIYDIILPYINRANREAGWNFQVDYCEPCQFTTYNKGEFFNWHADSFGYINKSNHKGLNGKIRKLSAVLTLSDPKDYEGGDLEVSFPYRKIYKSPLTRVLAQVRPQGSIIVFPSFLEHRVKEVTSGTRYSLVCWNVGYPYK